MTIEKTILDKVISKSTFHNTFDYFDMREREVGIGDRPVVGVFVFVQSGFLEKWGDDRFFKDRMKLNIRCNRTII